MAYRMRCLAACGAMSLAALTASPALAIVVGDTSPNAFNSSTYVANQSAGVYDGVAQVQVERTDLDPGYASFGTSTLLSDGVHMLTAAHLFTTTSGTDVTTAITVFFHTEAGYTSRTATAVVNPLWNGNGYSGNDIAIMTLNAPAPADATRYGIYTGSDEVGTTFTTAGYGITGNGNTGATQALDTILRYGQNKIDALGDGFNAVDGIQFPAGSTLAFDFDNGQSANDAFGYFFDIHDTGVVREVGTSHGDSGGPLFIDNQIAGITSLGLSLSSTDANDVVHTTDIDGILNSSFGEFAVDTRVSAFQTFIAQNVPEPASGALSLGLLAVMITRRRRAKIGR